MKKTKVLVYSLTKYVELSIMALVLLHFAKSTGPGLFGELSFSLVLISYSAFAVFGINAAYIKHHSISQCEDARAKLTVFNFYYNVFVGTSIASLIWVFMEGASTGSLALIVCMNLVRGSVQSILRAELKVWSLSLFNLTFSVLYFALYYYGVVSPSLFSIDAFLKYWSIALIAATFLGVLISSSFIFNVAGYSVKFVKENFNALFLNAVALFVISFGNTILLSSDRLILNIFSSSLEFIGQYQFADSVSAIFYLGSNAMLFFVAPVYMRKLSVGVITQAEFMSLFSRIAMVWLLPLFCFLLVAYIAVSFFFVEYESSLSIIVLLTFVKYFCLLLFIPVTLLTAYSQESVMIRCYYYTIVPMLALQVVFVNFYQEYISALPVISMLSVIFILVFLWRVETPKENV